MPGHAVPWQGTLILREMLSMAFPGLPFDLVGGRAGSHIRAGVWGWVGPVDKPEGTRF